MRESTLESAIRTHCLCPQALIIKSVMKNLIFFPLAFVCIILVACAGGGGGGGGSASPSPQERRFDLILRDAEGGRSLNRSVALNIRKGDTLAIDELNIIIAAEEPPTVFSRYLKTRPTIPQYVLDALAAVQAKSNQAEINLTEAETNLTEAETNLTETGLNGGISLGRTGIYETDAYAAKNFNKNPAKTSRDGAGVAKTRIYRTSLAKTKGDGSAGVIDFALTAVRASDPIADTELPGQITGVEVETIGRDGTARIMNYTFPHPRIPAENITYQWKDVENRSWEELNTTFFPRGVTRTAAGVSFITAYNFSAAALDPRLMVRAINSQGSGTRIRYLSSAGF